MDDNESAADSDAAEEAEIAAMEAAVAERKRKRQRMLRLASTTGVATSSTSTPPKPNPPKPARPNPAQPVTTPSRRKKRRNSGQSAAKRHPKEKSGQALTKAVKDEAAARVLQGFRDIVDPKEVLRCGEDLRTLYLDSIMTAAPASEERAHELGAMLAETSKRRKKTDDDRNVKPQRRQDLMSQCANVKTAEFASLCRWVRDAWKKACDFEGRSPALAGTEKDVKKNRARWWLKGLRYIKLKTA